ncbi:MAG: ATP-binding cassette domain-containing protein [Thaumarchaeota archaeon]|nr:ATP-binding cassette domain-containing protein [Candidatus Calditenuaceae archaeon]MDW8042197.1 ATP-binding cassette domain-containing protein [Nitrososphaerota archaeon]
MAEVLLRVADLYAGYDGAAVLEGVWYEGLREELVLLMGPNGAGKSTLLKTAVGLIRPIRGSVEVLGSDPWSDRSVRRRVAYVPQQRTLAVSSPLRVVDLVEMGARAARARGARDRSDDAMERVDVARLRNARLLDLSGGQLARALIARALAQDPDIYLLDEPFESIDRPSEEAVVSALEEEKRRGKHVLLSEHHVPDPTPFDRVVLLNRRVVAIGTPTDVLSDRRLLTEAYNGKW